MTIPGTTTARLRLRPFTLDDASMVQLLAGERRVAETTLNIPHPYPDDGAAQWIATHAPAWEARSSLTLAACLRSGDALAGAISLRFDEGFTSAEMGYWIGLPYWNQGYCTEAAQALLQLAFAQLQLQRVHAHYLTRNPASGRVMQKAGMLPEGVRNMAVRDSGKLEEVGFYGISHGQWLALR